MGRVSGSGGRSDGETKRLENRTCVGKFWFGILESPEYGRMYVRAQSFGWAKPGDTVEVTMLQQTSRFGINDEPWVKIEKVE